MIVLGIKYAHKAGVMNIMIAQSKNTSIIQTKSYN